MRKYYVKELKITAKNSKYQPPAGKDEMSVSTVELFAMTRTGYLSKISPVVKETTTRKPISFNNFAREYEKAFEYSL